MVLFLVFSLVVVGIMGATALRALRAEQPTAQIVPSATVSPSTSSVPPGPVEETPEGGGPATREPEGLPQRTWDELPAPNSTDPNWLTLQDSVLYPVEVPRIEGCPAPERAANMTDLERLATAQVDCLQTAYRPVLERLGLPSNEIPVYFYQGSSVDTPCGHISAPALYCSSQGGAIYFGEDALNGAAWVDFGTKDVAGHEYGHHLQAMAGLFDAENAVGADNETVRRLELQATCWGYAAIAHDTSVTIGQGSVDEFESFLRSVVEDGVHGSKESNAYWGIRGLYSRTLGNCNTWTVAPERVD